VLVSSSWRGVELTVSPDPQQRHDPRVRIRRREVLRARPGRGHLRPDEPRGSTASSARHAASRGSHGGIGASALRAAGCNLAALSRSRDCVTRPCQQTSSQGAGPIRSPGQNLLNDMQRSYASYTGFQQHFAVRSLRACCGSVRRY